MTTKTPVHIAILDTEYARVIIAEVPQSILDRAEELGLDENDHDEVATAILSALGLSTMTCDYMIGTFEIVTNTKLSDLVGDDFERDVIDALNEGAE